MVHCSYPTIIHYLSHYSPIIQMTRILLSTIRLLTIYFLSCPTDFSYAIHNYCAMKIGVLPTLINK